MLSCWCTETGPPRRSGCELASTPCSTKHLEMACASEAAVNSSPKEPLGTPAQRIMSPPLRWSPACRSYIPHLLGHVYQINCIGVSARLRQLRCAKLGRYETPNSEQL